MWQGEGVISFNGIFNLELGMLSIGIYMIEVSYMFN